jgi:2-polyprenyl-3-methyl-5-hydroxy-6-metoxy-1,4-benzoquinol methylase
VQRAFQVADVEFREANLERLDLAEVGRFDAVFCAGLLYHLPGRGC